MCRIYTHKWILFMKTSLLKTKISEKRDVFDEIETYTLDNEVKADLSSNEIMIALRYSF